MAEQMMTITVDQKEYQVPADATYYEINKLIQHDNALPALLARANGRLRELWQKAEDGEEISFLDFKTAAGFQTYRRSAIMLMMKAIYHVVGDNTNVERVGVEFAVGDGFFCTLEGKTKLTQEFLDQVEAYMHELSDAAVPFRKHSEKTYDACRKFGQYRMYDKEELFQYRRVSNVNIYELNGYEDYYYGYMVPDTSYVKYFKLTQFEDGFVLRLPTQENPDHVAEFSPDIKIFNVQNESTKWGKKLGIPTVGALNSYIVNHKTKDLILIQEAYHEKKIAEIAERIAADPGIKIVLIAGPSSSGKTTFSYRLSTQLAIYGLHPHPIAADDYFVDREKTPRDENGDYDFEHIDAIDKEQLNKDMLALMRGETVDIPSFNFKTGKREYKGNYKTLGENDILVIEGIHCMNEKLTEQLPKDCKFKIYISALTQLNIDEHNRIPTTDGRLIRRIVRDARTRGADAKRTIEMWPSVRRGEENNIFPYQEQADVMLNSALIYELAVLKIYAEPLLFTVKPEDPEYDEAKRLLKFLDYFLPIPADDIPNSSLIREFIGGGCFDL